MYSQTLIKKLKISIVVSQTQKNTPPYRLELRVGFENNPMRKFKILSQPLDFIDVIISDGSMKFYFRNLSRNLKSRLGILDSTQDSFFSHPKNCL